jgi:hypothetical protein
MFQLEEPGDAILMPRTLKPIRWTLEQAASEFGIDRKTLSNRAKVGGILAGEDSKFSTRDICRAVFTDGEAARASLAISQKENFDLRNRKLSGELVDPKQCQALWDAAVIALRQKIADSKLSDADKREILKDLQAISIEEYKSSEKNEAEESEAE